MRRRRIIVLVLAFQQRVALQFGLDVGGQVEAGKLQQLDRLHELRRHHQRLALAEFQPRAYRETAPAPLRAHSEKSSPR